MKINSALIGSLLLACSTANSSESSTEDKPFPLEKTRELQSLIVGGTVAPLNAYPWFAKALDSSSSWDGCGGTLVTPEFVLTAAHCISSSLAKYQIGAYNTASNNGGQTFQILNVAAKFAHEGYNSDTMVNDFALIKLTARSAITPVKMDQGTISINYYPVGKSTLGYDFLSSLHNKCIQYLFYLKFIIKVTVICTHSVRRLLLFSINFCFNFNDTC